MFETHEEYSKLLAGAHRRRVTTIAAPAAIRHLAFWNPPKMGPPEGETGADSDRDLTRPRLTQKRTRDADLCIAAVYRALRAKSREEPATFQGVSTNCEIEAGDSRIVVLFDGAIDAERGEPVPCPPDVRPDSYRAIKISLLYHRIKATLSFELHTEFLALTTVLDASEQWPCEDIASIPGCGDGLLRDFHAAMSCLASVRDTDEARCKDVHQQLYHSIWKAVDEEILAPLADLLPCLGKKFVDFRGVVLGVKGEGGSADFSMPFSRAPAEHGTGLERAPECHITDFDNLWKFITCALPLETEFTLSRFLDDRAFYATALGVQSEVFVASRHAPLYYLLFEDTLNPWQLGRLIYRVHRAGAARIAAIMHFDELRRARDILARVESTLEMAIWKMSQFGDPDRNPELRLSLRKDQAEAEAELSKISGLKLDGTLDSRIDRSRYYVNQFARMTQGLRIKRVVGFQPYDEFVNQRMGPVFEYIDSLGGIHSRVQNDRAALQGRIQALDSLHHEGLISEAQRIADIALSCALAPYYVGYMVAHALNGMVAERTIWLSATIFGLTMFVLIRIARGGDELPSFLSGRVRRFGLALAIAIPIAIFLNGSVLPPPAQAAPEHASPLPANPNRDNHAAHAPEKKGE